MSRSTKKGPYVDHNLLEAVEAMNPNDKKQIKTWARACTIVPAFVGHTFLVHNGRKFLPVYVSERMIGHKLGEFSPTRKYTGHTGHTAEDKAAAAGK